jgi:hypothetical protein
MFKNTFQSGFLSILYSIGSKPLQIWEKEVRNGHIKRITDNDIQSSVLEIMSTNISTTFITCPSDANKTLGIKLPFLVMIIKNVRFRRPPASPAAVVQTQRRETLRRAWAEAGRLQGFWPHRTPWRCGCVRGAPASSVRGGQGHACSVLCAPD